MSQGRPNTDLARDLTSLIRTLEDLQSELQPGGRRRLGLPTPQDVLRLTSEVAIPATIVALETHVRMLRVVQRAIRLRTDEPAGRDGAAAIRDRAQTLGRETLRGLDEALAELQVALEGRPGSDEAAALLDEARRLRDEVDAELAAERDREDAGVAAMSRTRESVDVDVDAELASLREEIDDLDEDGGSDDGTGPT